jgi:hypothetical protein
MQITVRTIFIGRFRRATLFSTLPKVRADYDEPIKEVMFSHTQRGTKVTRLIRRGLVVIGLLGAMSACGTSVMDVCSQAVSVPSYTTRFISGLDNFSEDQYENLRTDTLRTRETVARVLELYPDDVSTQAVLAKIDSFSTAMDSTEWDVSLALRNSDAVQGAILLGSIETISEANQIDVLVISLCGLPSTFVPNEATGDTLPMPWIPRPTDTEPESELTDETSEIYALGEMVGTLFQLTLTSDEVKCLGEELVNVVDKSDATSNSAQYQSQFQRAFDNCSIAFTVPVD